LTRATDSDRKRQRGQKATPVHLWTAAVLILPSLDHKQAFAVFRYLPSTRVQYPVWWKSDD
jgi:hypothetical protein